MKKFLGIDYGAKRIGLAIGDDAAKLARPLTTVGPPELAAAIEQNGPFAAVVVGLPRSIDGAETAQTLAVRRFTDDVLWRKLRIEPVFQDEAGTSQVAEERLKEIGKPYVKADIDAEAAAIILQDYLDTL
jgi:putative Holliday junction resolvase